MRRKAAEKLAQAERTPDLVDRIFELVSDECVALDEEQLAEAKAAVREELGGVKGAYIRTGHEARRAKLAQQILAKFNGRNATEVARELDISRATVYRTIKQAGSPDKLSQTPGRLETDRTVASAQPTIPTAAQASELD